MSNGLSEHRDADLGIAHPEPAKAKVAQRELRRYCAYSGSVLVFLCSAQQSFWERWQQSQRPSLDMRAGVSNRDKPLKRCQGMVFLFWQRR